MNIDFFPQIKKGRLAKLPTIYFDNAATTQKPQRVLDVMVDTYSSCNANVYRGDYYWSEKTTALYEKARQKIADFIGAKSSAEIIFTRNTTESINLIAQILERDYLKKGDEVIISLAEHHSNYLPWWRLAQEKKIKLKIVGLNSQGDFDIKTFQETLSNKTKLVAITGVSNVLGDIYPLQQIIRLTHKKGGLVLVDGAQWMAHLPINVLRLDCDFLAFSGHKMYGPTGIGVLYAKKEWLLKTEPLNLGGEMVTSFDGTGVCWAGLPQKFEAGTPAYIEAIGLGTAVDYLKRVGFKKIQSQEKALTKAAYLGLKEIKGVSILGSLDIQKRSGIIAFNLKGIHAHDLSTLLSERGIMTRAGVHCAGPLHHQLKLSASTRISFGVYNTLQEVSYFLKVMRTINHELHHDKK
ncbi:MAG: cysteine desulfurase [Candidatus Parcubacteria bacterium]|nr:cysteine desulfurase [Candidatus Parcubacteria bacterium]